MADERQWAGTTYGNAWMHKALISILRHTDIRLWYAFAAVFVVPPCIVFRDGYKPVYHFFRRHFGCSPLRAFAKTYTNHRLFSQAVIDKFAMYAGKKFDIKIDGYEHFLRLEKSDKSFVQLSSHIGNYELAGYTLTSKTKTINALVFADEKQSVMKNRTKMFTQTNIRMIPITEDMSHLYALNTAMGKGEIISMPADRVFGAGRTIAVDFLGQRAHFPAGPFAVATMQGLDVIAVNVMKTATRQYTIYVSPLIYDKTASRKEQAAQLALSYVAELEKRVREYPEQWYNYYEFWD